MYLTLPLPEAAAAADTASGRGGELHLVLFTVVCPLPYVPRNGGVTSSPCAGELQLEECLQAYMAAEELSEDNMWRCPKCKGFRAATKHFQLWKVMCPLPSRAS